MGDQAADTAPATVVFVHGNASTKAIWGGVIAAMPGGYRCIAFDLPGHGARIAEKADSFADFTAALTGVLEGIGAGPVHLVGHSLGGLICADVARRFPGRIETLSLLATPFDRSPAQVEAAAAFLDRVARDGLAESLGRMKDRWYTDDFARRNPDLIATRLAQLQRMDAGRFLTTYRIYVDTRNETRAADLPMPVLLLSGALADGFDTALQERMAVRHANITCRLYAGMKNGILTECPARLAGDLGDFIAAHSPPAQPDRAEP